MQQSGASDRDNESRSNLLGKEGSIPGSRGSLANLISEYIDLLLTCEEINHVYYLGITATVNLTGDSRIREVAMSMATSQPSTT